MPPKKDDEKNKDKKKKVLDKNRKLGMGGTIGIVDKPNKCIDKSSARTECPPPPRSCCQAPSYPPQDCTATPSKTTRPKKC